MHEREAIVLFLKSLRDQIICGFESLEPEKRFERTLWNHRTGGGGEISLLRGEVFEKAAVNWSGVSGDSFPMQDGQGPFFATGVSLITHMRNPHAPTVHMNIRYIQTEKKTWLGGGYDLTPMGPSYAEDTEHFHRVAKNTLDPFGKTLYQDFSSQAREYFYIPHRRKERGVGGIFFDFVKVENDSDFLLLLDVGQFAARAYTEILSRRIEMSYDDSLIEKHHYWRGRYAEFNLVYDRGTKFGLMSGGNHEAIFCSLPPQVKW